jgi:hypothetical protein
MKSKDRASAMQPGSALSGIAKLNKSPGRKSNRGKHDSASNDLFYINSAYCVSVLQTFEYINRPQNSLPICIWNYCSRERHYMSA